MHNTHVSVWTGLYELIALYILRYTVQRNIINLIFEKDSNDFYSYSQGVVTASVQQDTISKEYVIIFNTAWSR